MIDLKTPSVSVTRDELYFFIGDPLSGQDMIFHDMIKVGEIHARQLDAKSHNYCTKPYSPGMTEH
jgi:hypothetical protein